ncbi:MAG TPA: DUF1631 family protein [Noviherbaspirillum sp.]|nr:DUF1631 family protein [Noviherbaspirillum sp.]
MSDQTPPTAEVIDEISRARIMDELVDVAAALASAQLDGLTSRIAQALQEREGSCADPALAKLHANAAALLRKNRYPFSYVTVERLRAVLQHELLAASRGLTTSGDTSGALKALPPEIEIDKTLCLRKAGLKIDAAHDERLAPLALRLAHLFGRADLAPAPNPFRAQIFLDVLHDAWCEFHPDTAAHGLLYPLLGELLGLDPAPILHGVNMALVKHGVLPRLQIVPAAAVPAVAADALTAHLRVLLGHAPGQAAMTLLEPHALGRTSLLTYLDSLQHNLFDQHLAACGAEGPKNASVLTHIRRHAPAGSLDQADEAVLDLLAAVFGSVLRQAEIALELRIAIASLQLPMFKAALADHAFFFRPDQPARRSIELLAEVALGWDPEKGHTDPVFVAVRRNVERIRRGVAERSSVFNDAVWDLESFIRRDLTAADQILAAPIADSLREEKQRGAEKAARTEVALRVGKGEVVAFVETFLEDRWVPVLTLAYGEQDAHPDGVKDALKTMDDLVWSVKPKLTAIERRQLLALLPGMVAALNRWLDRVQWTGAERAQFFAELAQSHASLVRAPLETSPQRQVQLALEAAQRAAERRRQRQAQQPPRREPDMFDRAVHRLERGAWIEFAGPGAPRRLRLAWVSPMRSMFVFATRERQYAQSLTDEALAAALREERARIIESAGLVRRALCGALGLPANEDEQQSAA